MYKTSSEALDFAREFAAQVQGVETAGFPELLVCAPFTALAGCTDELKVNGVALGAQNMHEADQGAFTGEISAAMLKELDCAYVILGHSERRQYFAETDEAVAKKTLVAFNHQLTPIVCVGESLAEREEGRTAARIAEQVGTVLAAVAEQPQGADSIVFAYEPIWAIGTGRTASTKDAQSVAAQIRALVAAKLGTAVAERVRILYGGSVKPENIAEYMVAEDIDGALVGGASLAAASFLQMAVNSTI